MALFVVSFLVLSLIAPLNSLYGWHDETHLAVAKVAGYYKWYNAAGADIAKIKAGPVEMYNHYFNNYADTPVTSEMVLAQIDHYNDPRDSEGHLYGAIIASLRKYDEIRASGKYPEYHVALCAHYTADLSQPLHSLPYDDFNKTNHDTFDGIVDREVLASIALIEKNMYQIRLCPDRFEEDLAQEIARVANLSRNLGKRLREENRIITREEAYVQLGHSASLLRAILKHLGKI